MRTRTVRSWIFVHKWSSLVCTAFLLMLCVTGLPLIFHEEIDAWLVPQPVVAADHGAPLLSLDAVLARAVAARPGEVPLYLSFDTDRPVVNVTTAPAPDVPASDMHFAPIDRRTGTTLPAAGDSGVTAFLLRLHTDMLVGPIGEYFLGFMGLLFALAIVSGVVLYAPFMARLPFGTVRHARRARVRWTDLHNLFGIALTAWMLVVGLTGTINTLAGPVTSYWQGDRLAAMSKPYAGRPIARATTSIDDAVAKAIHAAPGMRPQFVAFPGVAYSSRHHVAVFLQGKTPATEKLLTAVFVDAGSGTLAAVETMPWYMKTLLLSQPLHFGDYAGMPLKVIWAIMGLLTILVLGSGLFLWWARGRKGAA